MKSSLAARDNAHEAAPLAPPVLPGSSTCESAYLEGLATAGPHSLVANVDTRIELLQSPRGLVPVTFNTREYGNCYICSPYNALVTYACEELAPVEPRVLRAVLTMLVRAGGLGLRLSRGDHCVSINNWLISTVPYRDWTPDFAQDLVEDLSRRHDDRYLLFRSIDGCRHPELCDRFRALGCRLIPMRKTYYIDLTSPSWRQRRNVIRDLALLEEPGWQVVEHGDFSARDLKRCRELYQRLYREKFSKQNPDFTDAFFALAHDSGAFRFMGLRQGGGPLCAFAAIQSHDRTITIPFIGYDTSLPLETACYRRIMALVLKWSAEEADHLNCGAGAGAFKRSRGGAPHTEYMVIYDHHLRHARRLVYRAAAFLMERIGTRIMLEYGL